MGRIVITGASGLLGTNLVLVAVGSGLDVIAISRTNPVSGARVRPVLLDLTDPAAYEALAALRPALIVHCSALTDLDACEADEGRCRRENADAATLVARAARAAGARLVHISTDAVFDGRSGGYTEADDPAPISAYGRAKLTAERGVLAEVPDALVVRTCIYGWNAQPKESLAEWFLSRLASRTPVRGWTDAIFTPILASDLGEIVLELADRGAHGVYHVAGATAISKYDFGVRIAEVFGLDPTLIAPSSMAEAALRAPRGRVLSLDVSKAAAALGRALPTVDDGLRRFRSQRDDGTVARLKALGGARADA